MERLNHKDSRHLFEFLVELYSLRDLQSFRDHALKAIPEMVASDVTSYNEMDTKTGQAMVVWAPADAHMMKETMPSFGQYIHEHLPAKYVQESGDGHAVRMSDFLSDRKLSRLALYNEIYRRVGVRYQMAITPLARPSLIIPIALNRKNTDFTERDRAVLNLMRPHLGQAFRNAEAVTQMRAEMAALHQVMEGLDRGIVELTEKDGIRWATPRAQAWLKAYWPNGSRTADGLPSALREWIRHQEGNLADPDQLPSPQEPLVIERGGRKLVVRLLRESARRLLVLEERPDQLSSIALEQIGLSKREAEVLGWVAQGKTNVETGIILSISARTVQKHLERVFEKLGVETRTAAAARALEVMRQ